jgi:hypothetical protein
MAVNQITSSDINAYLSSTYQQFNSLFLLFQPQRANAIIQIGVTALQAAPYSYSSADATNIFNACQDLNNLSLVVQGLAYVTSGATLNSGVPTANSAGKFGYPFLINVAKVGGFGA